MVDEQIERFEKQHKEFEEIKNKFAEMDGKEFLSHLNKAQAVIDLGYAKADRIRKETAENILYTLFRDIDLETSSFETDRDFNYGLKIALIKIKNLAKEYGIDLDMGELD